MKDRLAIITRVDGSKVVVRTDKIISLEPYRKETGAAQMTEVSILRLQCSITYILDNTVDHYAYLLA